MKVYLSRPTRSLIASVFIYRGTISHGLRPMANILSYANNLSIVNNVKFAVKIAFSISVVSWHWGHLHLSLNINNLVVIGTIINLVSVGSVVEFLVPVEVNWPGSVSPLSHAIPVLDWWLWLLLLSHPVEDFLVIGGVIGSLWPWSSPVGW